MGGTEWMGQYLTKTYVMKWLRQKLFYLFVSHMTMVLSDMQTQRVGLTFQALKGRYTGRYDDF